MDFEKSPDINTYSLANKLDYAISCKATFPTEFILAKMFQQMQPAERAWWLYLLEFDYFPTSDKEYEDVQKNFYLDHGYLKPSKTKKDKLLATEKDRAYNLQERVFHLKGIIQQAQAELDKYTTFCTNEADGTVNDTNCRIAIQHYKHIQSILDKQGDIQ